jgi:predicted enzyme related to lactoylglutathione lyase
MVQLTWAAAIILVEDVITTAEYYRDTLGFSFDRFWGDPPQMVLANRDAVRVALMQAPKERLPPAPSGFADMFIYVDSVDDIAADLKSRGARFVVEPSEATVNDGRNCAIIDCNRRVLSFVEMRDPALG